MLERDGRRDGEGTQRRVRYRPVGDRGGDRERSRVDLDGRRREDDDLDVVGDGERAGDWVRDGRIGGQGLDRERAGVHRLRLGDDGQDDIDVGCDGERADDGVADRIRRGERGDPRRDPDRRARVRAGSGGRRRRRSRPRTGRRPGWRPHLPTASAATANGPGSTGSGSGGTGRTTSTSDATANGPTTGLATTAAAAAPTANGRGRRVRVPAGPGGRRRRRSRRRTDRRRRSRPPADGGRSDGERARVDGLGFGRDREDDLDVARDGERADDRVARRLRRRAAAAANGPGSTGSGSGGTGRTTSASLDTANGPTTGLRDACGCGRSHCERPGIDGHRFRDGGQDDLDVARDGERTGYPVGDTLHGWRRDGERPGVDLDGFGSDRRRSDDGGSLPRAPLPRTDRRRGRGAQARPRVVGTAATTATAAAGLRVRLGRFGGVTTAGTGSGSGSVPVGLRLRCRFGSGVWLWRRTQRRARGGRRCRHPARLRLRPRPSLERAQHHEGDLGRDDLDGVVERVPVGDHVDGIVRGTQRGDLAPRVDRVPDTQLLADVLRLVAIGVQPALLDPARRPLLHRRVEVQLEVGIREHDGADVPPRDDDPAGLGELPLALQQRLAHLRDARDRGHVPVDDRAPRTRRWRRCRRGAPASGGPCRRRRGSRVPTSATSAAASSSATFSRSASAVTAR